ncbi:hypothetical protein Tco_0427835 [Tanacetum coccineum]
MNVIDAQCALKAFTSRLCPKRRFQKSVLENGFARAVRESANVDMLRLADRLKECRQDFMAGNGTAMLVVQRDDLIRKETYHRDSANEFMLLSPLMELIAYQPSPFVNLEIFEEMKALKNAESALNCMTELGEMLEHEKANIKTNIGHLDRVMAPMECHKRNMHFKVVAHQIETSFSRLCREADIVMNAIMNSMKIQSDEKQNRLSIYFHELATKVLQTIPAEVKKYLLEGSPSATFTEVSYEEMRALKDAESALNCMAELANIETNIAHLDQFEICDQIDSYWKDLSAQIKHGKSKTSSIVSKLCRIEELLTASCIKEVPD